MRMYVRKLAASIFIRLMVPRLRNTNAHCVFQGNAGRLYGVKCQRLRRLLCRGVYRVGSLKMREKRENADLFTPLLSTRKGKDLS